MLPSLCEVMVRDKFRSQKPTFLNSWNAEWVKVPIVETIQRVICATSNRVFVGSPLCT
jgi:hypothetical protein